MQDHSTEFVTLVCDQCGTKFTLQRGPGVKIAGRRYCGPECGGAASFGTRREWYFRNKPAIALAAADKYRANKQAKKDYDKRRQIEKREELSAQRRAYAKANPEIITERRKIQYQKNRAKAIAAVKEWRAANRERVVETVKKRREVLKQDPDYKLKRCVESHNRRAKKLSAGSHTPKDIQALYCKQGKKCNICKGKITDKPNSKRKFEIDHVVALNNGGSNFPENLQLLCHDCHKTKLTKDDLEYANSKGLLFC